MKKIYLTIYFLFITLVLNSCQIPFIESKNDKRFEEIYSKDVDRINRERTSKEKDSAKDLSKMLAPSSQDQRASNDTNSFDYVEISYIGSKKQEKYYPDFETYEFGKYSNPSNAFSPKIFEIGYNTYLNKPFSVSGVEFDFIDIPELDSYGVKSSSGDKNYTLIPIQSLQDAIIIINKSRTDEDIEFSKKLIADKKTLLRKKNTLRYNDSNEYTKFFEKTSEVNNIKIAEEEFVSKKQNNIN
jgi:hypothetical protein